MTEKKNITGHTRWKKNDRKTKEKAWKRKREYKRLVVREWQRTEENRGLLWEKSEKFTGSCSEDGRSWKDTRLKTATWKLAIYRKANCDFCRLRKRPVRYLTKEQMMTFLTERDMWENIRGTAVKSLCCKENIWI